MALTEQPADAVAAFGIEQVTEEHDYGCVNNLLSRGWVLLSVDQDPYGAARYVLGYRRHNNGSERGNA